MDSLLGVSITLDGSPPKGSLVRLSFELRSFLHQCEIASDATRCVARSNSRELRLSSENVTAAPSGKDLTFSEGRQSIFDNDGTSRDYKRSAAGLFIKAAKSHKPTATNENGLLLEKAVCL
jgi:hypothetical protein